MRVCTGSSGFISYLEQELWTLISIINAQQRRQMENFEFSQLAKELPLARAISGQHIDKTTMVRLATAYIKLYNIFGQSRRAYTNADYYYGSDSNWTNNHLDLLDGFFVILDRRGDVLYISETISIYLGLSQVEMTGNPMVDYIHEQDVNCFNSALNYCDRYWPQMCNVRVKSSLTKRANKDAVRASPGYKVLRLEITMGPNPNTRMIACYPMPTPVLSTVTISCNSFVIITSIDLRITYADEKAHQLLRNTYYPDSNIKGLSFYTLIDVSDSDVISKMHFDIFNLGAYKTPYYRMILNQTSQTFYVESNIFRHTSISSKQFNDSITFVSSIL
ncbi:Protein CBG11505 [Caenorhabditis briggsae]|uniref:Protein CBG11505 n=1 Tax=Caenorhabditis briggsae TaxID=6238 RepID=A8XCU6_CAEBR|nr:Protein CBG11505 [Caenorhabditis briggsae]CAP30464.1 Protein CBG11505 [Caenorhabditis briggsae]